MPVPKEPRSQPATHRQAFPQQITIAASICHHKISVQRQNLHDFLFPATRRAEVQELGRRAPPFWILDFGFAIGAGLRSPVGRSCCRLSLVMLAPSSWTLFHTEAPPAARGLQSWVRDPRVRNETLSILVVVSRWWATGLWLLNPDFVSFCLVLSRFCGSRDASD
jgi:hypothetical protein